MTPTQEQEYLAMPTPFPDEEIEHKAQEQAKLYVSRRMYEKELAEEAKAKSARRQREEELRRAAESAEDEKKRELIYKFYDWARINGLATNWKFVPSRPLMARIKSGWIIGHGSVEYSPTIGSWGVEAEGASASVSFLPVTLAITTKGKIVTHRGQGHEPRADNGPQFLSSWPLGEIRRTIVSLVASIR